MAFLRSDRLSFGSGLKLFRQIDVPLSIPQGGATGSGALRVTGLRALADRIQARAVRRMGELLKQFDGKGNNQHSAEGKVVALLPRKRPHNRLAFPNIRSSKPSASRTCQPKNSRRRSRLFLTRPDAHDFLYVGDNLIDQIVKFGREPNLSYWLWVSRTVIFVQLTEDR
jgi:hypothetical protein